MDCMDRLKAAWEWFVALFNEEEPEPTCAFCGHAESLHAPECRDVTPKGSRTSDWYCRCQGFAFHP